MREKVIKIDIEYLEYMWPMRHFLVTCGSVAERMNIIAVSFCMPVSKVPPFLACAIGKMTYSSKLIESTKEFVVNVPAKSLEPKIYFCGTHSGFDVDKFAETGLTPEKARKVSVPIINECMAHMECTLARKIETGDKNLFIGEVVEAYANQALVDGMQNIEFAKGEFPRKVYGTRFKEK